MKESPQKPNKHELLAELESIKASLLNSNDDDQDEDIPLLDDLVIDDESCPDTIEQMMNKISGNNNLNADKISSRPNTHETDVSTSALPLTKSQALDPVISSVLPGQQSLFTDETTPHPTTEDITTSPKHYSTPTQTHINGFNTPPENPFLPPHIRERLKQNRKDAELFYESLNLSDPSSPFAVAPVTHQQTVINQYAAEAVTLFIHKISLDTMPSSFPTNKEDSTAANIDRLTTLYLPMFEAQLRQQLTKKITTNKNVTTDDEKY